MRGVRACVNVCGLSAIGCFCHGAGGEARWGRDSGALQLASGGIAENGSTSVGRRRRDPEIHAAVQEAGGDPKTPHEARSRSDWPCWKEAMDNFEKALTWETLPRPPGKNVVGSRWVFRTKRNAALSISTRPVSSRRVSRRSTGVDYFDTFSPMAKLSIIRTIPAWRNFKIGSVEVKGRDLNGAYPLNGELDEDEGIYMQEPLGYETGSGGSSVKRLRKSHYGLKQLGCFPAGCVPKSA